MSENSEQTAGEMRKPELTEQQAGERRVNELFVRPLIVLGIARPKNMSLKGFNSFKNALAARLWRLETSALVAMREWVEMHPEAVNDNRWPSGPAVLKEANGQQKSLNGCVQLPEELRSAWGSQHRPK